tara:strand:+ start:609 stop:953 length:345 start_codon:yes stop_codon:yes gene_type:complete
MKTNDYKVEYEVQLKSEYLSESTFYVDVRENVILGHLDIKSKYVESFAFRDDFKGNMPTVWEKAEEKWNNLREKYEKKLLRGKGGILDHQNWIDGTSEIVEISIDEGEFHLPSD